MMLEFKKQRSAEAAVKFEEDPEGDIDSNKFAQEPYNGINPLDVVRVSDRQSDYSDASFSGSTIS